MKWRNKGHEFDEAWWGIKDLDFYIWGAGNAGKRILKYFDYTRIAAFIDSNKDRAGEYLGISILYAGDIWEKLNSRTSCILISLVGETGKIIEEECKAHGWTPGKNVFIIDNDFLIYEMPKLYAYVMDKVFFYAVSMNTTELCSLRCKDCVMSIPYVGRPKNERLEDMISDIDLLFNSVDMIAYLQLLGGEPLLNPELGEVIKYLHRNYKDQYGEIVIYTNGTVPLSDGLSELLKAASVRVYISDYSCVSEEVKKMQIKFAEQLKEKEIAYEIVEMKTWFDYGFRKNQICDKSEDEMIKFFDRCNPGCWTVHHGKLYYCYIGQMAQKTLGIEEDGTNYIDLRKEPRMRSYELMEWYEGYSEQGYASVCRLCNGQFDKSPTIPVAEQLDK